ncbi:helix-turn-helix domain-containing protein [Cuneatibacter caecimuris]|uniref:Cro/C1-type helix-turn-helix DNA-binding protein n=1 Tax=Cuneatibacter caecimuris TaxID=1796618 RepID=A0A4V2F8B6_9FIRM|nr:helix-turn-helix transcriptional regulator [Cuneatibacter caecimuris]RZT02847.1 Cro/C1-type helix-turn-helix DNA-binding protein [Cuneatibacter caecimuris]
MEKAKILERLIKESGYSIRSFALKCGIPESTLYTILKNGVGRASVNNVVLVCQNLGIRVEDLNQMAEQDKQSVSYEQMEILIARNGKKLTTEERMHLIKLLSENEK